MSSPSARAVKRAFARRPRWARRAVVLAGIGAVCAAVAGVFINELMTSNGTTLADENGDSPDWFELYNAGTEPVPLAGWGLSDDPGRPFKWVLRDGAIAPSGFLLLYASGKDRQPQPATPTSPETLPGLVIWLRADQVQTNDSAQVRTTGAGVFVRRWRNRASAAGDATQAATSNQPLWIAQGVGGLPALRFDGVNDRLDLPVPPATNSFCVFAVFRTSQQHESDPEGSGGVGGTSGQRYLFGARHGGDSNAGMGLSVGTNGVSVYEHGSGYMPALAAYRGNLGAGPAVVAVNYSAREPTLDVQGLTARSGVTSPRQEVTAPFEIGAGAYGAFGGDLAEVIVFNRSLPEAERRSVSRYLADKYGLRLPEPRHTNFQLNADGEDLLLTRPDGRLEDRVRFGPIEQDVAYGRQPDGGAPWVFFSEPTPGAANLAPGSTEWLAVPEFSHPGGFYTNAFDLTLTSPAPGR